MSAVDRRLAGERLAHALARRVHAVAVEARVGAGEVDELEEAQPRVGLGVAVLAPQARRVDHDHLAGLDVADVVRADDVERRGLAREHPAAALEPAEDQRPEAVRVAHADEVGVVHEHEREAAAQARAAPSPARARARDRRSGARPATHARSSSATSAESVVESKLVSSGVMPGQHPEARRELRGVGEVAVVPEREAGVADRAVDRLRVLPRRRAGGRVAVVPDREVALQRREAALVEHLGDEAHVLGDGDRLAVAHRDAGRLLAAVLEREQPEVGQLRDRLAGSVHAEDATGVARGLVRSDEIGGVVLPGKHAVHYPTIDGGAPMIEGMASRQACSAVGERDGERAVGAQVGAAGVAQRPSPGPSPSWPGRAPR